MVPNSKSIQTYLPTLSFLRSVNKGSSSCKEHHHPCLNTPLAQHKTLLTSQINNSAQLCGASQPTSLVGWLTDNNLMIDRRLVLSSKVTCGFGGLENPPRKRGPSHLVWTKQRQGAPRFPASLCLARQPSQEDQVSLVSTTALLTLAFTPSTSSAPQPI